MKAPLAAILLASSIALQAQDIVDKTELTINGFDSAETPEKVMSGLPFASDWKTFEWKGNKLLVGLSVLPTSGESYIDVHGYIYNQSFKEWRRFCVVKTRNVGGAEVGLDTESNELYLLAKANTPMKGKRVFTYSLLMLSDDRWYLPEAEQGGTGQPATRPESKSEGSDKPQPEAEGRSR